MCHNNLIDRSTLLKEENFVVSGLFLASGGSPWDNWVVSSLNDSMIIMVMEVATRSLWLQMGSISSVWLSMNASMWNYFMSLREN